MKKRTKIIATLGPSSTTVSKVEKMMKCGADVFRINLSHTNIDDARNVISLVRSQEKKLGRPVAIMLDLQGQKVRIRGFGKKPHIVLKSGDKFIIDTSLNDNGSNKSVGVTFKELHKNVKEGDELLLSDALIKLKVNSIKLRKIHTTVERGGKLKPYQGVNKKGGGLSVWTNNQR